MLGDLLSLLQVSACGFLGHACLFTCLSTCMCAFHAVTVRQDGDMLTEYPSLVPPFFRDPQIDAPSLCALDLSGLVVTRNVVNVGRADYSLCAVA